MFEEGTLLTGVNYWASHAATEMWSKWDAEVVERDFALLEKYGMSLVRVFPLWSDFQPIEYTRRAGDLKTVEIRIREERLPDTEAGRAGVDDVMMERFEILCDLAEKHHLKLIVCIMTAHMTFRLFTPRAMENMDLYLNPKALKWEGKYFRYFVRRMKHHSAIAAWESGNESNYISPLQDSETAWFWMNYVNTIIRESDSSRPVIGVCGLAITESSGKWLMADQGELADAVSVHPYSMWGKSGIEEFNHIRNLMFACSENRITEDISGKTSFIEEIGLWRPIAVDTEHLGLAARNMLWNAWRERCHAFVWWCAFDQDAFDIAPYGWAQPGLEHGVFTADGKAHPIAEEMKYFRAFLKSLPFQKLPDTKKDAVCILNRMDIGDSTFIVARQAGINLRFQSAEQSLCESGFYMLPSIKAKGEISTRNWVALKPKIADGATLYISLNDTYLGGLEELGGAAVVSRRETSGNAEYDFGSFKLTLPSKVFRRMVSKGADILASDGEGNPVFFCNNYGKGKVYTLSFELEEILYASPGLFESDARKIYELMFKKVPLMKTESGVVIVTDHYFDDANAACVAVNCGMNMESFVPHLAPGWRIREHHGDAVEKDGSFTLPPNCGSVFLLEK